MVFPELRRKTHFLIQANLIQIIEQELSKSRSSSYGYESLRVENIGRRISILRNIGIPESQFKRIIQPYIQDIIELVGIAQRDDISRHKKIQERSTKIRSNLLKMLGYSDAFTNEFLQNTATPPSQ